MENRIAQQFRTANVFLIFFKATYCIGMIFFFLDKFVFLCDLLVDLIFPSIGPRSTKLQNRAILLVKNVILDS